MGLKKKQHSTPKYEPQWRLVERVVAALEKAISPGARVRHDVVVPDITTGHPRQCDVLIEFGEEPRITRTLVEVQRRRSRVKISDLQAWWAKMHAIGAQHLICVSALDFPQSVKEEVAKKLGPSVKLLRLTEVSHAEWPLKIVSGVLPVQFRNVTLDRSGEIRSGLENGVKLPPGFQWDPEPKILERPGFSAPISLTELLKEWSQLPQQCTMPDGNSAGHAIICPTVKLWLSIPEGRFRILQLEVPVTVHVHSFEIPVSLSKYEQFGHDGALAWAVVATGAYQAHALTVRLVYRQSADGRLRFSYMEAESSSHSSLELKLHSPRSSEDGILATLTF